MNRGDQREGVFRDVGDRQKLPPTPGEICQKRERQVHLSNRRYGRVNSQAIWHAGLANKAPQATAATLSARQIYETRMPSLQAMSGSGGCA
jgi:hypothetical protein